MKKLLLLTTLTVSLHVFSQGPTNLFTPFNKQQKDQTKKTVTIVNLKDSSLIWSWSSNLWSLQYKTIYSYNTAYKENGYVYSAWNGVTWDNANQSINYTFDANNNPLGQTNQYWNSSAWQNTNKMINTYDAANNQLTSLSQIWNAGTLAWINDYYVINTYDVSNNQLTLTNQSWNTSTSTWVNSYKYTATYNASNQYTLYLVQVWDIPTNAWVNQVQITNITYVNNDMVSYEAQNWNNTTLSYQPDTKSTSSYDANHHQLNMTTQSWNTSTSAWENSSKVDYTYDANGNPATIIYQNWVSNTWVNSSREYDYYRSFVGLNDLVKQNSTINIYPNPATDYIIISNTDNELLSEISISDITGKVIMTEKITPATSTSVNVAALTPGIYFMTLKGDGFTNYKKIVKN